jgi:hypothetical protein
LFSALLFVLTQKVTKRSRRFKTRLRSNSESSGLRTESVVFILVVIFLIGMQIELQDRVFEVPLGWKDCTKGALVEMVKASAVGIGHMSRVRWEHLIRCWLGADWQWWKGLKLNVNAWEVLKLEVSWVFEERLLVQPFVFFEHGGVKYYLPEGDLNVSAAIDVSMGAIHLMQIAEGNMGSVDWLLAVFCRPERRDLKRFRVSEDWNGDVREVYQDEHVRLRALAFANLDEVVKVIVLKYLEGLHLQFFEEYGELFGKDDKEPRYGDGRGWLYVLKNVAKANYFRSLDEVWRSSAGLVWGLMLDDALDGKEEKTAPSP